MTYHYNPANDDGLTERFIGSTLKMAGEEWNDSTGVELVGDPDIDGNAGFHDYRNGKNEVCFGDYPTSGVIAVCRMWVTRGKPSNRRIVEFDLMFDTDYTWGDATLDPSVMDGPSSRLIPKRRRSWWRSYTIAPKPMLGATEVDIAKLSRGADPDP